MIHLEDVKQEVPQAESAPAEQTPAPQEPAEQTETAPEVSPEVSVQERTVPITALQEERKRRQELQRQLAQRESEAQLGQYDPEDLNTILQHPMVQELILKDAKRELTDYARDVLEQYPTLNPQVKKAILRNARGFVNETTTDLETAKVDLLEQIEEFAQEVAAEQAVAPKGHQVASTNVPTTQNTGAKPSDIQKILDKPVTDWTNEEEAAVEAYAQRSQK